MPPAWDLHIGDCREVCATLPPASAVAGVYDPPSGMGFMGLDWDLPEAEAFAAMLAECFRASLRVLIPGAWVAVWAHPQTSHWTAIALCHGGFTVEMKIPWINGEAKPQPWRTGRLAPGHEEWILARAPGPRMPLSLRLWRDATGGRHPRALVLGQAAAAILDAVLGRRRSGAMTRRAGDKPGRRSTYGANKASPAAVSASDGGPSRYFPLEQQLLAVYGPRARHCHRDLGPGGPRSEHPTPKAPDLLLPIVDLVAGELAPPDLPVLDIFAGTGAVGEAALLLGRGYVGVELGRDPRWPVEARTRLERVSAALLDSGEAREKTV